MGWVLERKNESEDDSGMFEKEENVPWGVGGE